MTLKGPKRICLHPGCNQLVQAPERYCIKHKEQHKPDANRPNSYKRGYTREWQRYRISYLAVHPFCVQCEARGELREATVVDHIKPHKGNRTLFWDPYNHQALCKRCHDSKTATKDGGFGRKHS